LKPRLSSSCHYWSRLLCRGLQTLGKASHTLGKAFAERSSRQSGLGKNPVGKAFFAESQRSSRQRKGAVNGPQRFAFFAESLSGWLSAKSFPFFLKKLFAESQSGHALGKCFLFFKKKISAESLAGLALGKIFFFF
jgi:hypothetical protein